MRRICWTICLVTLLASCTDTGVDENKINSEANKLLTESGSESAEQFSGKLDELLTLEMAAQCTGYDKNEAVKDYSKVLSSPETHSLTYEWKDKGRKKSIDGFVPGAPKIEVPVVDEVKLSWVRNSDLEKFKRNYHTPTRLEMENADRAVNDKLAKMKAEGKISKEQSDQAKDLSGSLSAGFSVTPVENLGDYAVIVHRDLSGDDLKVLYKNIEFQINVSVSDNPEVNTKKAIALAKRIIAEKLK